MEQEQTTTPATDPESQSSEGSSETTRETDPPVTDKPEGWDKIDYDALPPELRTVVEQRVGRLYGQLKNGERTMRQMGTDNAALLERVQALETAGTEARTTDLTTQLAAAVEADDSARVATLTEAIIDTKSKANIKEPAAPASSAQAESPSTELDGFLSQSEQRELVAWAGRRPWMTDGHPMQAKATTYLSAVLQDDALVARGMDAVGGEMDRLMGHKTQAAPAAVLSSHSAAPPGKSKTPALSVEQKRAAELMGITAEDYRTSLAADEKLDDGRTVYRRVFE